MHKYLLLLVLLSCKPDTPEITGIALRSNTASLLQAISILNYETAWVSGHAATVCRTTDAGHSWQVFQYPIADTLQFRDLHAFSAEQVVLMSAGPGAMSRIFLFTPPADWEEVYVMPYGEGFLNTIEFWDDQRGLAFGDSFDSQFFILRTMNGGTSWERIDPALLPEAGEGEGGFAASGTCIAMQPEGAAWIGTGAGGNSRILVTGDFGESWEEYGSPLITGEAAGITSIRMATAEIGTIVGGDLLRMDTYTQNSAITVDGGKRWTITAHPATRGALYGSDITPHGQDFLWIVCGPNGMDYSADRGTTWQNLDTLNYWAVDLHPDGFGYATGKEGLITRLSINP